MTTKAYSQANARRGELIRKDVTSKIDADERHELEHLERICDAYVLRKIELTKIRLTKKKAL